MPAAGGTGPVIDSHQLAGISKHTFNVVGLYEKGPIGLRARLQLALALPDRRISIAASACRCSRRRPDSSTASIRFSVTRFLELSVDGTNLLNTRTVYQQEIFGDSPLTPGAKPVYMDSAWTRVDRRFQFGIRVKF